MAAVGTRLQTAIDQARKSASEGGIPIGSVLVYKDPTTGEEKVLGQSHNQRIQKCSATLHAEISALEAAGRLKSQSSSIFLFKYTTLSPCSMCTGAILLFKIPRVVIGENVNFLGSEELLRSKGVEVTVLDDLECKEMMAKFIRENPNEWYEDIGE